MRKIVAGCVLAIVAVLALPATGQAFKFGAKLSGEPDNSAPAHTCKEDSGGGDLRSPCTRVAVDFQNAGGAVSGNRKSPSDGVVTRFKVRAGAPGKLRFKLVKVKNLDLQAAGGKAKATAKSERVNIQGNGFHTNNPIETFHVHMKVDKGEYIAIDSSKTAALRCNQNSTDQLMWSPPLAVGDPFRHNDSDASCSVMVQAVGHG